jgi:hypothetical protein
MKIIMASYQPELQGKQNPFRDLSQISSAPWEGSSLLPDSPLVVACARRFVVLVFLKILHRHIHDAPEFVAAAK